MRLNAFINFAHFIIYCMAALKFIPFARSWYAVKKWEFTKYLMTCKELREILIMIEATHDSFIFHSFMMNCFSLAHRYKYITLASILCMRRSQANQYRR